MLTCSHAFAQAKLRLSKGQKAALAAQGAANATVALTQGESGSSIASGLQASNPAPDLQSRSLRPVSMPTSTEAQHKITFLHFSM